jgi:hypothetical protein
MVDGTDFGAPGVTVILGVSDDTDPNSITSGYKAVEVASAGADSLINFNYNGILGNWFEVNIPGTGKYIIQCDMKVYVPAAVYSVVEAAGISSI